MPHEHDEHEHIHDDTHEHENDEGILDLEADTQSRIFLEMRAQNLELLRIAAQVAGYAGTHGPLKQGDVRNAMKGIWDVYAEFYSWIDPEETDGDDEEEEE
jgi:hypothetical protein